MTEVPTGSPAREMVVARSCLAAARLLADAGFHRDAVTRAYYAVFHAACALLASIGRTVRTHEGLRSQIHEHFARPGLLDPVHTRVLRRIAGDRSEADYTATADFSAEDSEEDIAGAAAFLDAARSILDRPAP